MESRIYTSHQLPPGFRFHPSDEELIVHYLRNKVSSREIPGSIIGEIDLYKYNPWELPKKAPFGEDEWYFFSPRNRKYPNGERPNRAAASGYWKATGIDRTILTSNGSKNIGVKKSLVFYISQSPKGVKTDWMMSEYRLPDMRIRPSRSNGTMRLDDWVLCRVRKKGSIQKHLHEMESREPRTNLQAIEEAHPANTDKKDSIFTKHINKDCPLLASLLSGQPLAHVESILSVSTQQGYNNCNSVFNDGSVSNISPTVGSSVFATVKRKQAIETMYGNVLPSKKVIDGSGLSSPDMLDDNNAYIIENMQPREFGINPSNSHISIKEVDDEAALGNEYFQQQSSFGCSGNLNHKIDMVCNKRHCDR